MGFYNDVLIKLGLPPADSIGGFKVTALDGKGVLVEGHRGLLFCTETEIVLRAARTELVVSGSALRIAEYNKQELFIAGEIDNVNFRGVRNNA